MSYLSAHVAFGGVQVCEIPTDVGAACDYLEWRGVLVPTLPKYPQGIILPITYGFGIKREPYLIEFFAYATVGCIDPYPRRRDQLHHGDAVQPELGG